MAKRKISEITQKEEERVKEIFAKSTVIELLSYGPMPGIKPEYLREITEYGITSTNFTATECDANMQEALISLALWHDLIEEVGGIIALTADDIEQAKKEGKPCVTLGMQNAKPIEDQIALVRVFHKMGVRIMQLSYDNQNYLASGGRDEDIGLSTFGRSVVKEMNRLGMLVDVSHCGDKTTMDAIECSDSPITFTHANPRTLVNVPRNKSDEMIRALAERGGCMGVLCWSSLCQRKQGEIPTAEDFLDFIDYIVDLVGPDHVGYGLDLSPTFDDPETGREDYARWAKRFPDVATAKSIDDPAFKYKQIIELNRATKIKTITKGLVVRGYSDKDIMKVMGGNFLELFRKVFKA